MKSLIVSAAAAVLVHVALFAVPADRQKPVRILPPQRAVRVTLSAASRPIDPLKPLQDITAAPVAPLQPLALKQPPPKPRPEPLAPAPQPVAAPKIIELPPQPVAEAKIVEPPADATPAERYELRSSSMIAEPAPDGAAAVSDEFQPVSQVEPDRTQPAYELNPLPEYPLLARRRNYQGTVLLNVLVDAMGRAARIELVRSSGHDILDRQALKSVTQWRFQPATRNGQAVESWVEIPVRFELK